MHIHEQRNARSRSCPQGMCFNLEGCISVRVKPIRLEHGDFLMRKIALRMLITCSNSETCTVREGTLRQPVGSGHSVIYDGCIYIVGCLPIPRN